jgi:hypothetical protein
LEAPREAIFRYRALSVISIPFHAHTFCNLHSSCRKRADLMEYARPRKIMDAAKHASPA